MDRQDFTPVRTYLSQQSYPGARRVKTLEEIRSVNPMDGRAYTIKRVECPGCGRQGRVADYHGTNCFWDCPDCETGLKG